MKKKKTNNNIPKLWLKTPELYPQILESFRHLENSIIQYHLEKKMKVFLFTGAERQSGVSTVTFNLAMICSIDMPELQILLIDANLAHPGLKETFDIESSTGMSDVLDGNASRMQATQTSCRANLHLLPPGDKNDKSSSLFIRQSFITLLESIKNQYDLIFIDSAPFFSSSHTQSILPNTDGVIVVAEAGRTRVQVIRSLCKQLRDSRTKLIGSFLNRRRYVIPHFLYKIL